MKTIQQIRKRNTQTTDRYTKAKSDLRILKLTALLADPTVSVRAYAILELAKERFRKDAHIADIKERRAKYWK